MASTEGNFSKQLPAPPPTGSLAGTLIMIMTHRFFSHSLIATAAVVLAFSQIQTANATTVPFTETFDSDSANWFVDSAGTDPVGWVPTLPDGGGFASVAYDFANATPMDTPVLFRAQDSFDSSDDAFVGDWIADGVTEFRVLLRHDADTPLTFFTRFASPFNFPGAVALGPFNMPGGVWTELVIPIEESSFIFEGPSTFEGLFSSLGNIQFGVLADPLAGANEVVTFSLDNASIVPEPATLVLVGIGACALVRRRRTQ